MRAKQDTKLNKKKENRSNHSREPEKLPLDERQLREIAQKLHRKFRREDRPFGYVSVKEVLSLLGRGALVAAVFLAPGAGKGMRSFAYKKDEYEKEWRKYNDYYLRKAIKQLQKQKLVKIEYEGNNPVVKINQNGKERILKYALAEIELKKPLLWDGKWRLVIYDIPKAYSNQRKDFQATLKRLNFYQMQKSVYISPYSCIDEIDYLRHFLRIQEYVKILLVDKFEDDWVYREYFDLE